MRQHETRHPRACRDGTGFDPTLPDKTRFHCGERNKQMLDLTNRDEILLKGKGNGI